MDAAHLLRPMLRFICLYLRRNALELEVIKMLGEGAVGFGPKLYDMKGYPAVFLVAIGTAPDARRLYFDAVPATILVTARHPSIVTRVAALHPGASEAPGVMRAAVRTTSTAHSSDVSHA